MNPSRRKLGDGEPYGDIPQSTLAAQLVNHLTDGKKHSKIQDRETFNQLVREILNAENDPGSQKQAHAMDSEVDSKLIYVIVKAGLEKSSSDDPFGKPDERPQQILDRLKALHITLTRNSEALFLTHASSIPNSCRHSPLFLWLIPKLLSIPYQLQDERISDAVLGLLKTILVSERKMHGCGTTKYSIPKYVKGCITG